MEEFFALFPADQQPVLAKQNITTLIYKQDSSSLTITVFRTTHTVSLQGKEEKIKKYAEAFEKIHGQNKEGSIDDVKRVIVSPTVGTEKITPTEMTRSKPYPSHAVR